MAEFEVRYIIQVEADSPLEAALKVEGFLTKPVYRPCLVVISETTGEKRLIDLEGHNPPEEETCH